MASPLLKSALGDGSHRLPPRIPQGRSGPRKEMDFSPLPWSQYFSESHDVIVSENSFRVYSAGATDSSLMVVLLHGGGYCGLTWALFASELTKRVAVHCLAIDLRGHGDTHTTNDQDLSAGTMCQDIAAVVKYERERRSQKGTPVTGVILLGHSMGGALAVRVASQNLLDDITGVIVIDVVEGTAIEALGSMQTLLKSRPQQFSSIDAAISWSIKSGQTRNIEAARISMPGQVVKDNSASHVADNKDPSSASETVKKMELHNLGGISEEGDEEGESGEAKSSAPQTSQSSKEAQAAAVEPSDSSRWVWRIDLSNTEHFWSGWFENLSKLFLSLTCPRVLVLAGMDRLDKDLTVGQMRGQFQLQVLDKVGHAVQEDAPDRLGDVVASFLVRNKLAAAVGSFTPHFPCC